MLSVLSVVQAFRLPLVNPMPTRPQLARLFALARNAGVDNETLHDLIKSRFKLDSVRTLSARQYEDLTRSLAQRRVLDRTIVPPTDIVPFNGVTLDHPCHGHMLATAARADGEFYLGATEDDIALAGKLLDCFRTYRKRGRIMVHQARAMMRSWLPYHVEVWREAARRYLEQASTRDEKYFAGILRRVQRDSALDGQSVQRAMPLRDAPASGRSDLRIATPLPPAPPVPASCRRRYATPLPSP